ncbi:methylated-DNA-protein-cysteine methyltransferase [Cryptococcus neoformans]|nr:methylated-DNA-protein-cysteine methyltransferase [Cryptococcus neoformans var. grubii c45]OXB36717.1 methylated-DNA-protein-cysteine methyltransferase [Cryptococcus neoformans var. grubii]OXC60953.1 methylated-DNA-protein-cysteine methyltransferase [Cryptococcus neoformans var. grubii MW-RSA852]
MHAIQSNRPRMGDIADLTAKTYDIARLIPPGRVTSYGHIAKLAGYPTYSRHVGNALKMLPPNSEIPWQRVVNSKGIISPRGDFGLGVARQKERLEDEGVEVETLAGAGGERVDLRRWGWFPETLPQDGEE